MIAADRDATEPQSKSGGKHFVAGEVIFVDLGPTEGRGERVISAIGQAYSKVDAPCYVV
jgi:hypothetical protein